MDKGVFDRFRVLPIARIAPLAGPMVADMLRYAIAATLTFATGIVMGYRPGGGVPGVFAAIVLAIITGWSLAWVFTWFGTVGKSAQVVQGFSLMVMFPLTFLSNAFVPAATLPDWLQTFVKLNPVSHVVSAVRSLANEGQFTTRGRLGAARLRGRDRDLRAALRAQLLAGRSRRRRSRPRRSARAPRSARGPVGRRTPPGARRAGRAGRRSAAWASGAHGHHREGPGCRRRRTARASSAYGASSSGSRAEQPGA